jgi:hypothetical protein
MFAILPVFALAFIVLALVASDYHTRNVGHALSSVPSMGQLAKEALDNIIIDTAHARMMRRATLPYNGVGTMLDNLVEVKWCVAMEAKPEIKFTRSWNLTVWERLILALGVITALVGLSTVASAQDVSEDLVCHIVTRDVAVCHTVDHSAEYVCAWTVDGVSNCHAK